MSARWKTTDGPIVLHDLPPEAYRTMARVLRIGIGLALLLLAGALVAFLIENPGATSTSVLASNPIAAYLTLPGLAGGLASGVPEAYLTLGLLVLVATPIARVLCGSWFFQRHGEVAIARVTATVFGLLILGLVVLGPIIR